MQEYFCRRYIAAFTQKCYICNPAAFYYKPAGIYARHHFLIYKTTIMKTTNKPLTPLLLAIIAVLGTAVIYLAGCAGKKETDETSRSAATGGGSPYCADVSCLTNGVTGTQPGMISFATAKELASNFLNDPGKNVIWKGGQPSKEQDARCIWFDLEKMKRFIGHIESAACNNGCPDSLKLGVRIYYAKYPGAEEMAKNPDLQNVPKEYANMHTIFMVPTYRDWRLNVNIDFDPQSISKGCKILPMDYIKNTFYLGFDPGITSTDAQNHGSLRPPPDSTGFFPETGTQLPGQ